MHIIQEEIGVPKIKVESSDGTRAMFSVGPLPPGYGMTLGNALRRVLLSSLPGAAVTAVKVNGASHEYSALPGIRDSVLDIILNLKLLNLKKHSKEPEVITLEVKKDGIVKASDIKTSSDIEILNPDQEITYIDKKKNNLKMSILVEKGVGYLPAKERESTEYNADMILIDALYSPVTTVRYDVKPARVGQMTDLDKLNIEIETDGTITPDDALKFASNLLKSYFGLFNQEEALVEPDYITDTQSVATAAAKKEEEEEEKKEAYTPIEILNLSPRTLNSLINGNVGSVEQLLKCTESKLTEFRGFGKKAMTEVKSVIKSKGLVLKGEEGDENTSEE